MKVRIDRPCFIESEGPFTIIPIYQAKAEDPAKREMFKDLTTPAKKQAKPRFRRSRKVCPVCKQGFLGISRAMYCSDRCRHEAYNVHGGSKKAREALFIHAGASGVEVKTDDQ